MTDEKRPEIPYRYYNCKFTCPTYDMTGECKHFPAPFKEDRCQCCGRPKGSNPDTECNFTITDF